MTDSANGLSFSGRLWRPRAVAGPHHAHVAEQVGLSGLLGPLLAHRGLTTVEAAGGFLNPRLGQLEDPSRLQDMDAAVARLVAAVAGGEPIAIFGDYDVGGATASALLVRYFRALGVAVRVYIPDRLSEGYGPNVPAMEALQAEGIRVVVTVDCGIASFDALAAAQRLGLAVIVTDHHLPDPGGLPPAQAVIDPNRADDSFPHKELAGVGLAFYLAMALNRALRQRQWFTTARPEPDLKQFLDLVALGTVADVAPLTGLNRPLVAAGLRVAAGTVNPGIRALMERSGLRPTPEQPLTPGQVGFQLGPRINAGGRLAQGRLGSELLWSDDPEAVAHIVQVLEASNRERQGIEQGILEQALALVAEGELDSRLRGLVLGQGDWHPGVVGIVASRLAERFNRPTIVVALDPDGGTGKGSGRSIPGVDLLAAVRAAAGDHLLRFGGHRAAAGLTLAPGRLEAFAAAFDQAVREQNGPEVFQQALLVDAEIPFRFAGRRLLEMVERFQPFGRGNPEPLFVLPRVRVTDQKVLKDRHLKCQLNHPDGGPGLDCIAFGVLPGALGAGLLRAATLLDVAGTLSLNRFRGREAVQFVLRDARPCCATIAR